MLAGGCVGHCGLGDLPPPDSILSMPPPPLPAFLLPKLPTAANLQANDTHPCYATFMCEPNPRPREGGMEFVEFTGNTNGSLENTWLFVLISSCVGVLILGGLLAIILLKCRDTLFSSCNFSYHDSNIKQGAISALGEPSKSNPFLAGGILYPCTSTGGRNTLQRQLANDSRLLWATLTPHGTRHFISDYAGGFPPDATDNITGVDEEIAANEVGGDAKHHKPANAELNAGHYEIVDYRGKMQMHNLRDYVKGTPIKSFDNNGFIDYDYEDPTPLMDSYHDDMDSGYQEPQEVIGTLTRASPRLRHVSSPTRIEHPNIAPLNYYPANVRSGQQMPAQSSSSLLHSSIHSLQRSGAHVQLHNPQQQLHPFSQLQHQHHHQHSQYQHSQHLPSNYSTTLNRKSSLNRRISDASSVASFN